MTDSEPETGTDPPAGSDDSGAPAQAVEGAGRDESFDRDATRCPYCGRPLGNAGLRALHVGEVHDDEWTDAEREAYGRAYDAETDALFRYHFKVIAALVVLTFGLVYTYVFVLA